MAAKHWVTADIHGAFSSLWTRLVNLGFNPKEDILFSLGDLVNRGEESSAALQWMHKPWFKPVMGNHEAMVLNADQGLLSAVNGSWYLELSSSEQSQTAAVLSSMPYARTINVAGSRIGLVHADVPEGCTWSQFTEALSVKDEHAIQSALWSRARWQASIGSGLGGDDLPPVEGVDWVFVGHSPVDKPTIVGNVVFMDCGLWRGNTNGIICLEDWLAEHSG